MTLGLVDPKTGELYQPQLTISGSVKGKRSTEVLVSEFSRNLTAQDLATLRDAPRSTSTVPALKSLRASHHKLALLLAQGDKTDTECSVLTGYSTSRISILKNDPAFKELLAHYTHRKEEVFVEVQQRLAGALVDAVEVMQERLSDSPEAISNKDLNDFIKTTADRSGFGPITRTHNINENRTYTPEELQKLKESVKSRQVGNVRKINHKEEIELISAHPGSEASLPVRDAEVLPPEAETPGEQGQGGDL